MKNILLLICISSIGRIASAQEVFCQANFDYSISGLQVLFISLAQSTDSIISWNWDFDDNNVTSTLKSPVHTFSKIDKYRIQLEIVTLNGCRSRHRHEIDLKDPCSNLIPAFDFNYNRLDFKFQDHSSSTSTLASWTWDFDDRLANSSVQNPFHRFSKVSNYTVCLDVSDASCLSTRCLDLRLPQICALSLNLKSIGPCDSKGEVTASLDLVDSFEFVHDFNVLVDGMIDFLGPYTISPVGTYNLVYPLPGDGASHTIQVVESLNSFCRSEIPFTTPLCSFQSPVKCRIEGKLKNIGPCSTSNSVLVEMEYKGDDPGNLSVFHNGNLISNRPYGKSADTLLVSILGNGSLNTFEFVDVITSSCTAIVTFFSPICSFSFPCSSFSASYIFSQVQNNVYFTNRSSISANSWKWTFGDQDFSQLENPFNVYANAGDYMACLEARDTILNCLSVFCDTIRVRNTATLNGDLDQIKVFPNPIQEQDPIIIQAKLIIGVEIFDSHGQKVFEKLDPLVDETRIYSHEHNLSAGNYILRVHSVKQQFYRKLTIY